MSENKKKKKKDIPPYTTFGLAGGEVLSRDGGTTRPKESNTEEMRDWSEQHEQ